MIVKQASIEIFAKKYFDQVVGNDREMRNYRDFMGFLSGDSIFVKRNDDMAIGESVIFEITDRTELLRHEVKVSIAYMVEDYDSICFKLVKVEKA